jgi:hypothetical protein
MGMGKTLQAVSVIVTHPREGLILGPDAAAPVATSPAKAIQAKSMLRLRVPTASAAVAASEDGNEAGTSTAVASMTRAGQAAAREEKSGSGMAAEAVDGAAAEAEAGGGEGSGVGRTERVTRLGTAATGGADKKGAGSKKAPARAKGKGKGRAKRAAADETGSHAEDGCIIEEPEGAGGAATAAKGREKTDKAAKTKKPRVDPLRLAMEQAKTCHAEEDIVGVQGFCKATLVVCPVVAAMQWRQEILRYTSPGMFPSPERPRYSSGMCTGHMCLDTELNTDPLPLCYLPPQHGRKWPNSIAADSECGGTSAAVLAVGSCATSSGPL